MQLLPEDSKASCLLFPLPVLALTVPNRWSVTNCASQLPSYKAWSFCPLFLSSPPPLLNFDTFQFSIWLSTIPRRKIHTVWKRFAQQNVLFRSLSGSSTRLTKLRTTAHRTQGATAILLQLSKNKCHTAQEKAAKLKIWFCSNLLHLFCIQLLIMSLSRQQSWLMVTEPTRTPNEHNPPHTEEM